MTEQLQWTSATSAVRPFSRATVADGKTIQAKTMGPLSARDEQLLEWLNGISGTTDQKFLETSAWVSGCDKHLQEQIDTLNAAADVVNIFNSKADFDIVSAGWPGLTSSDIIKVLHDEDHADKQTYYQCGEATSAGIVDGWEYIGEMDPYYSTSEIDDMLTETSAFINNASAFALSEANEYTDDQIATNRLSGVLPIVTNFTNHTITNNSYNVLATGSNSWAEGSLTSATGYVAHAEGDGTLAFGSHSHAEGQSTRAAMGAHAEGASTSANGFFSHAEGQNTRTSNDAAHAEGSETLASGYVSHAEGDSTSARGLASHAEGSETLASGKASHAGGISTYVYNNASFGHGRDCFVSGGEGSFAVGNQASAFGYSDFQPAIAIGEMVLASGAYPGPTIAMGKAVSSVGHANIAFGYKAEARGEGGNFVFGFKPNETKLPWWGDDYDEHDGPCLSNLPSFGAFGGAADNLVYNSVVSGDRSDANHDILLNCSYTNCATQSMFWRSAAISFNKSTPVVSLNDLKQDSFIYTSGTSVNNSLHNAVIYSNRVAANNLADGALLISDSTDLINNVVLTPGEFSLDNYISDADSSRGHPNAFSGMPALTQRIKTTITSAKSDRDWRDGSFCNYPIVYDSTKTFMLHDNLVFNSTLTDIIGEGNFVREGNTNIVIGHHNNILENNDDGYVQASYEFGLANKMVGEVRAAYNIGQNNVISGTDWKTYAANVFNIGVGNFACNAHDVFNFGFRLRGNNNQVILGRYNKELSGGSHSSNSGNAAIFMVGNGYQTSNDVMMDDNLTIDESKIVRSNAMTIYENGNTEFSNNVSALGNMVANKFITSDGRELGTEITYQLSEGGGQTVVGELRTNYDGTVQYFDTDDFPLDTFVMPRLPTRLDEGKILSVKNGKAAWAEAPDPLTVQWYEWQDWNLRSYKTSISAMCIDFGVKNTAETVKVTVSAKDFPDSVFSGYMRTKNDIKLHNKILEICQSGELPTELDENTYYIV